ncbi:MAG: carboxypeptidase-like regulatory domain-containing protein [Candidatus Acidiferrales bacterium]
MRLSGKYVCRAAVALFLLTASAAAGEEQKVRLEISVNAESSGEPVGNASVYIKFKKERWLRRDKPRAWNLKTNPDGKTLVPEIPEGQVLVQVVKPGWKTFGKFYDLTGPKQTIEIKLQRPKTYY